MSICKICGKEFTPDKYHPRSMVCPKKKCQYSRQLESQRKWRKRNPKYFTYKNIDDPWAIKREQYLRKWREEHPDYFREYNKNRRIK